MKKIVSCMLSMSIMLSQIAVFASFDSVVFDRDTNMVNILGNAGENMEKQLISVVLKSGENVRDIKVIRLDENSDFECSFKVLDETALYEVLYQTAGSEQKVNTYVNTYSSEKVKGALGTFSSADTKEDMQLFFSSESDYVEILGISDELIEKISNDDMFYESLLLKANGAENVKDVIDLVNETAIAQIFTEAPKKQISELIKEYSGVTGISSSELYKNYTDFTEDEKADFEEKFENYTFTSLEDIINAFETCVILTEIQNSSYYTDTKSIIEKYYEKLSISMDYYNKLTDSKKKEVMKELTGNNSKNADEFETDWEETIDSVKKINNSGGGSGSGGGRGNGNNKGGAVVIVDTSKDVPVKVVSFIDMDDALWAKDAVLKLANDGVINGKSEYKFCPNDDITRAEYVKILIGALGFETKSSDCEFNDVKKDSWAYPYVCTAVENKIVFGYSDKEFGADDNITRQDMVVMLMRAIKQKNNIKEHNEFNLKFYDTAEIDEYALYNVRDAVYYKMVDGMGDNYFKPKAFATRAQAAMLIFKSTEAGFDN